MKLPKTVWRDLLLIIVLLAIGGVVYAVTYGCFPGLVYCAVQKGGTTQQLSPVPGQASGTCINITNNDSSRDVFVPANTVPEWSAFTGHLPPNVSLSSPAGQACTPPANSCGMTNTGTYNSCGICSVTTPADSLCSSCTYAWSSTQTVCSNTDNTAPFSPVYSGNGNCDATDVGYYKVTKQTADPNCNIFSPPSLGDQTHYEYQVCNVSCPSGPQLINGTCGPAAAPYSSLASFPAGAFCAAGTASPASPANPAQGGSTSWTCLGANGGGNIACSASRTMPTYAWASVSNTCVTPPSGTVNPTCDATDVNLVKNGSVTSIPLQCSGNQPSFSYQICTQY